MSKRLIVTVVAKIATLALAWHAIGSAAAAPDAATAIAAMTSAALGALAGGSVAYAACETKRPSGTTRAE